MPKKSEQNPCVDVRHEEEEAKTRFPFIAKRN